MKRIMTGLWCVASAGALWAADPRITPNSVSMEQDDASRIVTIRYALQDAPGIVTLDVTTNGVSIGPSALRGLLGDVNRKVEPGDREIKWLPQKHWRNQVISDGSARAVVTVWHPSQPPTYMVLDLDPNIGGSVRYFTHAESLDADVTNEMFKTRYLVMRKCPAAGVTWRMGAVPGQTGYNTDQTAHTVSFSHDFYIGVFPCTQAQYQNVMGSNPSNFKGSGYEPYLTRPVEKVSYETLRGTVEGAKWPAPATEGKANVDPTSFFGVLNGKMGLAFDLPTEAQWEFACRAGTDESCNLGVPMTAASIKLCAWSYWDGVGAGAASQTHPVGLKRENAWGIYDMHGNVWEWCRDWYGAYTIPEDKSPVLDPLGAEEGTDRIIRVGGYSNNEGAQTCAFRNHVPAKSAESVIGFRLALTVGAD